MQSACNNNPRLFQEFASRGSQVRRRRQLPVLNVGVQLQDAHRRDVETLLLQKQLGVQAQLQRVPKVRVVRKATEPTAVRLGVGLEVLVRPLEVDDVEATRLLGRENSRDMCQERMCRDDPWAF